MSKSKVFVISTVILGLAIFMLFYKKKVNSISSNRLQTVAKITGSDGGHATSGPSIYYLYIINNKKYNGSAYIKDSTKLTSKFYVVRYSSENYEWSQIDLNRPVTDSLEIIGAGFSIGKE